MREIERHLCAQCAQEMKGAFLHYEELKAPPAKKEECDWCHRMCYGTRYRIFYGRKEE
jgi:hypothetical protein